MIAVRGESTASIERAVVCESTVAREIGPDAPRVPEQPSEPDLTRIPNAESEPPIKRVPHVGSEPNTARVYRT